MGVGVADAVVGAGDVVAGGGAVVWGTVVGGAAGEDAVMVGAVVVAVAVIVALAAGGVYGVVRGGAVLAGRSGDAADTDEPAGVVGSIGERAASVGAGSPGPSGCGAEEDDGRSAIVAATKTSTTTTAPTAAAISANRLRPRAPAGSSTYLS